MAGPGAASLKYDVLTALLALASQGPASQARLALRLSLIITARYSWRRKVFATGQKELGRMWGVTERTAKRDLAAMRSLGWLSVERPSARGRVAEHRVNFETVLRDTAPFWEAVGPDFAARMSDTPEQTTTNVVPLRAENVALPVDDGSVWSEVARKFQQQDPAVYSSWLAKLEPIGCDDQGLLSLMAPSRFVAQFVRTHYQSRLRASAIQADPNVKEVLVMCAEE